MLLNIDFKILRRSAKSLLKLFFLKFIVYYFIFCILSLLISLTHLVTYVS